MHPQQVTVWCGFWCSGIIGPFFFENEQGAAVTAKGEHYRAMLNEFLFPVTQVNDQKTASGFVTDSYRFWGAESRKNSQNFPSRHVFLQNLIS